MAVDEAPRRLRFLRDEPLPADLRVLVDGLFRRETSLALAEPAVVDREHRIAEPSQLRDAIEMSGQIPARAVQVVDDRCLRIVVGPPPGVNALRSHALAHRQVELVHALGHAAVPSRGFADRAEDELALLELERHASADRRGDEQRAEGGAPTEGAG